MALIALALLCGCGPAPGGGSDAAEGNVAPHSSQATDRSRPAAVAPPSSLPDIPVSSAALEDRPALQLPAPVRFTAPDLGIDVPIEAVGLDDLGRMGLPADPAVAAWYRFGAAPGGPGSTVVAAHVDSLVYDIGPFAKLADAPAGTRFEVTTADGVMHEYQLAATEPIVPKEQVDWSGAFAATVTRGSRS